MPNLPRTVVARSAAHVLLSSARDVAIGHFVVFQRYPECEQELVPLSMEQSH